MIRRSGTVLLALALAAGVGGAALAAGSGGGSADMPSSSAAQYDPVAEYQNGVAALKASQWKDAERAFGRVTQAAPKASEGWFMLGYAKASGGDLKGARKAYEKAAKLKPEDIDTRRELAVTLARVGETAKAKAELDALKARDANCAGTCPDSAALKTAVGRIEAALAAPTPAAALTPGDLPLPAATTGDTAYLAAVGLINEKRWADAWAALDDAARALGPHPDILTWRGYVLRRMGELDAAEGWYRAALAVAPNHRGATEYYGELKVERGDMAGARVMLARLDAQCAYGCAEAEELRRWIDAGGRPL